MQGFSKLCGPRQSTSVGRVGLEGGGGLAVVNQGYIMITEMLIMDCKACINKSIQCIRMEHKINRNSNSVLNKRALYFNY